MKNIILLFLLIFSIGHVLADGDAIPPKGKIKGTVADAKTKEPLEYASVALYNAKTNELITGVITDYLGHFKLERPVNGDYYLKITFIGLKDKKTELFQVDNELNNINLGNIFMESASQELGEVEVVAKRAMVEYKIDKKVINVDKQLTAEAGTAVDVLENVPSVQVDVEGNVSLRGSSGFTVLIDGKPTILDPSDALRQIPSSSIENIEIITNPSAKFEPDGAAGIINIVTKKNYLEGLSGIINANVGMYNQYGGDLQLSYRVNKFNFVLGANYGQRSRPGDVLSERETFSENTIYFVNSYGDTDRERKRASFNAGVEYNPTKKDFVSLSGRYGEYNMTNHSTLRYDDFTLPETDLFSYNSFDETQRGGSYFAIDGVYQRTFRSLKKKPEVPAGMKSKGPKMSPSNSMSQHNLKFEFNYRNRVGDEFTTNELRDLSDTLLGGKKNVEKGPSESLRLKLEYTLPLRKKDKFETGFHARMGHSNDVTELWLYDVETGEIIFVPDFSNTTDYYRNIYAAYAMYAGYLGKFGYQAGLRAEYTDRTVSTTGEDDFLLNRWDYFPTLHMSYSLPKDQEIMASYTRRINRPRGWYLEPFITWQDAYNVRQGNPELKPEYIDSFDAGYLLKFNDNFLSLEGYYRVTHNKIERVTSVYQDSVLMHTIENVGEDYSLGVEAMLKLGVTKWWDMDLSGNFYNYKIEGVLYDEPFSRTSTNWSTRFNNTFTLWKNGQLQLSSRYNSETVTAQGTSSGFYTVDAAFKVSFLQRSLSVNLQGRDLLGTSLREHTSEGQGFTTYYKYDPYSPMVMLTVSYRFNNFKMKRSSNGSSDGEDDF